MKKIAVILGTRPEIIKLAPVVRALRGSKRLYPYIIASGQHRDMAEQAFQAMRLRPDVDLELMGTKQSPNVLLGRLLLALEENLAKAQPDFVLVQGDTSTALGGALAAFQNRIPVGHVEAGLRTFDLHSPFPEEMNRQVISRIASLHFCATEENAENLRKEGCCDGICVVGNPVVDAMDWISAELKAGRVQVEPAVRALSLKEREFVLVTGHRRENFDGPLRILCASLQQLVNDVPEISVVFPVHPNPKVDGPIREMLSGNPLVHLLPPVDYPSMMYLLSNARLVISDSGGIQEEVQSLGTPLLVTRKLTERPEALASGIAMLCELSDERKVLELFLQALAKGPQDQAYRPNPFGDGEAAYRICNTLERFF